MKWIFQQYLLEPLDLVLQLHLPGPVVEVGQPGGGAAAATGPLRLQLEELQMLQLSTQVLYQLRTHRERTDECYVMPMQCSVGGRGKRVSRLSVHKIVLHTSCMASFSFWYCCLFCLSLSIIFLYRSISSFRRKLVSSSLSVILCFSWRWTDTQTLRLFFYWCQIRQAHYMDRHVCIYVKSNIYLSPESCLLFPVLSCCWQLSGVDIGAVLK